MSKLDEELREAADGIVDELTTLWATSGFSPRPLPVGIFEAYLREQRARGLEAAAAEAEILLIRHQLDDPPDLRLKVLGNNIGIRNAGKIIRAMAAKARSGKGLGAALEGEE